ncbi:MAG: imidazole glycerol phosphate synthase subunit HisH [Oscillospiraceae bacterium]|nr:imidazole glycerol phosphate synthase subunit HisH [Oscillospiraceae bacterium]
MIAIIDYGAGNLHSVKNALDFLGADSIITGSSKEILEADKVILPGVGAFGDAMRCLNGSGLSDTVKLTAESGKPLLGICLGLQLMFEESEESPGAEGLGIFKGKTVKIPDGENLKIPHMGWNSIKITKESKILKNIGTEPYVYFVHSYYINAEDADVVSAYTEYGQRLDIAVEKGNIFATQFHPEKSGETGMKILKNFIALKA